MRERKRENTLVEDGQQKVIASVRGNSAVESVAIRCSRDLSRISFEKRKVRFRLLGHSWLPYSPLLVLYIHGSLKAATAVHHDERRAPPL